MNTQPVCSHEKQDMEREYSDQNRTRRECRNPNMKQGTQTGESARLGRVWSPGRRPGRSQRDRPWSLWPIRNPSRCGHGGTGGTNQAGFGGSGVQAEGQGGAEGRDHAGFKESRVLAEGQGDARSLGRADRARRVGMASVDHQRWKPSFSLSAYVSKRCHGDCRLWGNCMRNKTWSASARTPTPDQYRTIQCRNPNTTLQT